MHPVRVAVMDDEPIVRREIKRSLKRDHFGFGTFPGADPAIRKMGRWSFDPALARRVPARVFIPEFEPEAGEKDFQVTAGEVLRDLIAAARESGLNISCHGAPIPPRPSWSNRRIEKKEETP